MIQVTAAIILRDNKILIAQRAMGDSHQLKWEFPGGKIEKGETPEQCLKRELHEEFSIDAKIGEFFCRSIFAYPDKKIELLAYWVKDFSGEITVNVHNCIAWASLEELSNFDFAQADVPIVLRLQTSDFRLQTSDNRHSIANSINNC